MDLIIKGCVYEKMGKEYRKFSTPEEVEAWVKKHYTEDELRECNALENVESTLAFYKGVGYRYLNKCVRGGKDELKDMFDIESLQQQLLSKNIKDDIVVYRFVDKRELDILLRNTSRKRIFEYEGFLSTTLLREYYSMEDIRSMRIPIEIRIPKGTHGTYLPEVNPDRPEYEILLPYHLKIKRISWWKCIFEIC